MERAARVFLHSFRKSLCDEIVANRTVVFVLVNIEQLSSLIEERIEGFLWDDLVELSTLFFRGDCCESA